MWIRLAETTAVPPRFKGQTLSAGDYLYLGSAYGPGGIRARCKRHLQHDKKRRWHVDWLTTCAVQSRVLAFPGGIECDLVDAVRRAGGRPPIPGFGSSDCLRCTSHLLTAPAGMLF